MALEFPFVEVDVISMTFGGIPNYREVVDACPQEFERYHSNPWCEVAAHIFFFGVKPEESSQFKISAANQAEADMKMNYFRTWLGSFNPPHEVKMRVCGWLLSLMLEKPPVLTR